MNEYEKSHKSNLTEEFKINIKSEEDFVKGIIVQEEIYNVWSVIKETCFKENKKYFKHARDYKKNSNIDFNITIFSEEEIEEIKEELKSYSQYEVF